MENFNLSIPTPCHEKIENFKPTQRGGFCGSCQKEVIDFRNLNDSELVTYIKNNQGKEICGSFRKDQLQREYSADQWFPEWIMESNTAIIEMPLMQIKQKSKILRLPKTLKYAATFVMMTFSVESFSQTQLIKGKILDAQDRTPLPGVMINIKGTKTGTSTNTNGEYEIKANMNDSLIISYIGYEQEILRADKANFINLELDTTILGELVSVSQTKGVLDYLIEKLATKRLIKKQPEFLKVKVVDDDNNPMAGASVKFVGTKKGVVTDSNGEFEFDTKKYQSYRVEYLGYEAQEIKDLKSTKVTISQKFKELDELMVKGKSIIKQSFMTGGTAIICATKSESLKTDAKENLEIGITAAANPIVDNQVMVQPFLKNSEYFDSEIINEKYIKTNAFKKITNVWVYDFNGKQYPVTFQKINDGAIFLNLNQIPNGAYVLKMSYLNEEISKGEIISFTRIAVMR